MTAGWLCTAFRIDAACCCRHVTHIHTKQSSCLASQLPRVASRFVGLLASPLNLYNKDTPEASPAHGDPHPKPSELQENPAPHGPMRPAAESSGPDARRHRASGASVPRTQQTYSGRWAPVPSRGYSSHSHDYSQPILHVLVQTILLTVSAGRHAIVLHHRRSRHRRAHPICEDLGGSQ